ncbi:hypothetical protein HDU96_009683 [Phlyctochytrium bullatum]|nr:hypothetical protein HDU96_009683 [Phlyctochytrium bullatum]
MKSKTRSSREKKMLQKHFARGCPLQHRSCLNAFKEHGTIKRSRLASPKRSLRDHDTDDVFGDDAMMGIGHYDHDPEKTISDSSEHILFATMDGRGAVGRENLHKLLEEVEANEKNQRLFLDGPLALRLVEAFKKSVDDFRKAATMVGKVTEALSKAVECLAK